VAAGTVPEAGGVPDPVGAAAAEVPRVELASGGTIGAALDFERAYLDHFDDALRWATGLVSDPADAADLVHEAFVRIFSRVRPIRDPAAFRGYLRQTIVHGATSRWRTESRDRARAERSARLDAAGAVSPSPDESGVGDPRLVAAVQALPARQRAVLILRYWLDWSEADIAGALGCRPGTVKSLAARALAALRTELGDDA
jgi:RNA polymerase sigma-70 factor (sigma-E family)